MNPTHLHAFLAVQRHMNYTRAAEELHLSQPAVSRQVKQLEETLGVSLFEQLGKALHLTDAGRAFVGEAERVLGVLERAAESIARFRGTERGRLRLGASTTPGYYVLPEVLRRFRERFSGVDLHFVVANSLQIERMLVRNEIDLGFVGGHLANEDLDLEPLLEDEIVCFAAHSHPLAKRRRIDPASPALAETTWVVREHGSATRQLFESWLTSAGGAIGKTIEISCSEAIKVFVDAGLGVSFMSELGLRRERTTGRFKRLPLTGLRLRRPIYIVRHGDKHSSPVMTAFLDMVRSGDY